jgi:hypothetical protein
MIRWAKQHIHVQITPLILNSAVKHNSAAKNNKGMIKGKIKSVLGYEIALLVYLITQWLNKKTPPKEGLLCYA